MSRTIRSLPFLLMFALTVSVLTARMAHSQAASPGDGFDPAQLEAIAASVQQVPLTEDMVNRLIASYPDMRAAGEAFPGTQLPDDLPDVKSGTSDLDALPADKRKGLDAVAVKHGFKGLDEWSVVASSVVMSYVYTMQGKRPGAIEEAVKLNIAQAERDKTLSDDEKEKTIAQYRQIGATLARMEPLKENFELVTQMKDKIAPVMDAH